MPDEERSEEEERQPEPETRPDEFSQLAATLQNQMNLDNRDQAAVLLGNMLRQAGVGQKEERDVLEKIAKTYNELPQGMPMSRATMDQRLSQEMQGQGDQGQLSQQTINILRPMMPFIMAYRMLDMFSPASGRRQQKSSLEEKIQNRAVDMLMGEETKSGDKLDEISSKLTSLNRQFREGEVGRGTALEQLSEQAEELQDQMEQFGNAAETMGYTKESKGTLEKITDVSKKFNELIGNLRKSFPGREQKPERKVTPAGGESEKPKPKEKPTIPVEKESEGEAEEPGEEETEEESEQKTPPRDERGRFISQEEKEELEASEESEE